MHFLVTGGAGFIGSHICERLLKEGHTVTVLDNLHTGSKENLDFAQGDALRFVQGSAGQVAAVAAGRYDGIFHQGVYSSSPMYKKEPLLTAKALEEFIALLEFARVHHTPVVFASSSSLYNGVPLPHREDAAIPVMDYYTEARLAMERMAELYHTLYGMRIIALRYFSVYGPREKAKGKYANLITQFIWSLQKGEVPVIYGDGGQSRDFVYVDDVATANIRGFQSAVRFGVFNVGTGKSTSLNDMLALLNKQLGKNTRPSYMENKIKNYVAHTQADIHKAEKELGFKASVSLEEGIGKLIAYYGGKP